MLRTIGLLWLIFLWAVLCGLCLDKAYDAARDTRGFAFVFGVLGVVLCANVIGYIILEGF